MKLVILTNDNYFSFSVLKDFLKLRKNDIKLIVFSSALIGKRGVFSSSKWSLKNTGLRHTIFKLLVYGVFRVMRMICRILPVIPNNYSSLLWAQRNQIKHIFTRNLNDLEVVEQLKAIQPDLIVSVSMNQIVKKEILTMPSMRCINVHCAPLPRYGGMSPYVWALADNEDHSAATIHYMEEGLDVGDIIVQERIDVVGNDSAFALFNRCCLRAGELLPRVVDQIEDGSVEYYQQDLSKKTYFSWPTKESVERLRQNGYSLARTKDFVGAILHPQLKKPPSVFVTYGWCRSSYAVVQSLGRHGVDVHVGDTSPFAMSRSSRYCKSFTRLPDFFLEPEEYFDKVCQALKKTGAKVLLPGHEDLGIFTRFEERLPEGVCLAMPPESSYGLAENKFNIIEFARETKCLVAETFNVNSTEHLVELAENIDYPAIVKAKAGNSAKGVRVARSKKELIEKYNNLVNTFDLKNDRLPIVQEFLPGAAAGVCLLYEHGECKASFAEEYLRCKGLNKFGTSTLRSTFDNKNLISQAISVMDELNWHGVAHLDFVADREDNFKLIEINPRLWGALSLAVHAGIDFPYLWYRAALGKNIPPLNIPNSRKIKSRWIVGDCLAFFEFLKHGKLQEVAKIFRPYSKCYHDDFNIKDPLPFVFEILDYLAKYVKSGFSTNPVTKNMVR